MPAFPLDGEFVDQPCCFSFSNCCLIIVSIEPRRALSALMVCSDDSSCAMDMRLTSTTGGSPMWPTLANAACGPPPAPQPPPQPPEPQGSGGGSTTAIGIRPQNAALSTMGPGPPPPQGG